jgi:hypothetical protein
MRFAPKDKERVDDIYNKGKGREALLLPVESSWDPSNWVF